MREDSHQAAHTDMTSFMKTSNKSKYKLSKSSPPPEGATNSRAYFQGDQVSPVVPLQQVIPLWVPPPVRRFAKNKFQPNSVGDVNETPYLRFQNWPV